MVHGLESHSGWFAQSARRIAEVGLPVLAFDRRGSGLSDADAEGGARQQALLAEIDVAVTAALQGTRHRQVHLVGHCFGALISLLYAALYRPERVASLVLATPALYTHTDLPALDKVRVLWSVATRRPARVAVPLSPDEFSELEPFVDFVRNDPLVLRSAPARLFYEIRQARRKLAQSAAALSVPLMAAMAGADIICDNARNSRLLAGVRGTKSIREYAGARHILEFSGQRRAFLDDLATWFESQERS